MSRVRKFTHSLLSGYALIGANVIFTLASVPLALHYLSKEEFGLWALVMQMANFNMILIDLGMSGSLSRILIDHKDDKESSSYGTVIQTGFLVLVVQAVFIAVVGGVISLWLPQWMHVPEKFWPVFRMLMIWQCVVLGVGFVGRIFGFILSAHQRYDICNYASIGGFVANLLVLWVSFQYQLGLYSILLAYVASTAVNVAAMAWGVQRFQLLPARGRWGRPSRAVFRELFSYGTDIFLLSIGQQLIVASQVPVISRVMGLEAAAVWSVAVKVFVLAQQMIYRIFDFSAGALAEMIVRGEAERLKKRFGDLVILTGSTAAAVAVMLALCNHGFLQVWTHGRITWDSQNDLLMAVSFFVYSLTRLSIGLMGVTKRIGAMKFIYFIEGAAFAGLALWWAPRLGFAGVILSGILTNCLMSGIYGMRRAADYFHISVPELLRNWLNRPVLLFAISGMAALVLWLTTRDWNAPLQLAVNAALCGSMVLFLFWRLGVPERLRKEVAGRFFKRGRLAEV